MGELAFSKEGAGIALGLIGIGVASGKTAEQAMERLREVYGGAEGMKLKMKGQFDEAELVALASKMTSK